MKAVKNFKNNKRFLEGFKMKKIFSSLVLLFGILVLFNFGVQEVKAAVVEYGPRYIYLTWNSPSKDSVYSLGDKIYFSGRFGISRCYNSLGTKATITYYLGTKQYPNDSSVFSDLGIKLAEREATLGGEYFSELMIPNNFLPDPDGYAYARIVYKIYFTVAGQYEETNFVASERIQIKSYSLTINKSGTGSGTVISDPSGINCGTNCSRKYPQSMTVTLTATPAAGSTFAGWSGDCSGTQSSCTLTMNSNKNVTATFNLSATYRISPTSDAIATAGSVVIMAVGTTQQFKGLYDPDGPDGSQPEQDVTKSASWNSSNSTAAPIDSSGKATCKSPDWVTITSTYKGITATAELICVYLLTVNKSGTGSGTVTSNPIGIDCGTDCLEGYLTTKTVTLTATPAPGSYFAGWSGDCSGTQPSCTLTMNSNKSVTATFNITSKCGNSVVETGEACDPPGSTNPTNQCQQCSSDCKSWVNKPTCTTCTASPYCSGSNRCGILAGDTRYYNFHCSGGNCVAQSSENCRCDATDSDGGKNYTTKGTCTDYNGCSNGSCQSSSYTDYCLSSTVLREYYVSGSGDSATCSYTDYDCTNLGSGYGCSDGKCVSVNQPPTAKISCTIVDCRGPGCQCDGNWVTYNGEGVLYRINNDSTDQDKNIVKSTWSIIGYLDPFGSCSGLCNLIFPRIPAGNYTIKLKVEDAGGLSSEASHSIQVKQDIIADFQCSLDGETWKSCSNLSVLMGQVVYVKDISTPSEGAQITSRVWKKGDGKTFETFAQNKIVASTTLDTTNKVIRLEVKDNVGREGSREYTLSVTYPLPKWREIPPMIWLRKLLAAIGDFVKF